MTTCPPFLVLIGTKAQFIKTAPILREMDLRGLPYTLVYTGQHSETFELLERTFATRPAQEKWPPIFGQCCKVGSALIRNPYERWLKEETFPRSLRQR